jgi:hypothetical protein
MLLRRVVLYVTLAGLLGSDNGAPLIQDPNGDELLRDGTTRAPLRRHG